MNMEKTVCYCAKVTVQDIANAIANGAKTTDEIQEVTKAATCCGRCEEYFVNVAEELLEQSNA